MRIGVVGSRDFPSQDSVADFVQALPADAVVVSGGARGVDTLAVLAAKCRGLRTHTIPARWAQYGKRAGFLRNVELVRAADCLVAFWDGASRGTRHTIGVAKQAGIPVEVVGPDSDLTPVLSWYRVIPETTEDDMGTRFVAVPAERLLGDLRECGRRVVERGGSFRERVEGREVVVEVAPKASRVFVRVYTSLGAGQEVVRDCGEDAVRVVVGALTPEGFRPLRSPTKVLRTAPAGVEDRAGVFVERLRGVVREAYLDAARVSSCPKCGRLMAVRTAKKSGRKFLGCLGYPKCDGTSPLPGGC